MDYLTNYYKNLSEQLQERVNHLQNLLEASYPGGLPNERFHKLTNIGNRKFGPNATEKDVQNYERARALIKRGKATDLRKAQQERLTKENQATAVPDFHNTIVGHMSQGFSDMIGGGPEVAAKMAAKLNKRAGQGGFKSFDHASDTMADLMLDDSDLRDHMESQALEDPTKYMALPDDIMDVDMSDEVTDLHGDLMSDILHVMTNKKSK